MTELGRQWREFRYDPRYAGLRTQLVVVVGAVAAILLGLWLLGRA